MINKKKIIYCLAVPVLVITAFLMTGATSLAASTKEITGVCRYDYAYKVLDKSNAARKENGKNELTMDKELMEAAMIRAAECAVSFEHNSPNGNNCFDLSDKIYAENLAEGQESPQEVVEDWLGSSGHRTNLLNNAYKSIGVGVFEYNNRLYWVQLFGKAKADAVGEPDTGEATYAIALTKSEQTRCISGAGISGNPLASKVANVKLAAGKNKLTLTWAKKSGVTGYIVQISDKKSFKSPKEYTLAKSKKKLVIKKYKNKKLKSKKKYYVRIRAYIETENTITDTGDSVAAAASDGAAGTSEEAAVSVKYSKWKTLNKKAK
ncbi:MAG: CAP domain-containing protein [Lachnospiraceae bacterium]|nr:CAP domain-containing protein [Lachnospiraceae bacterium]